MSVELPAPFVAREIDLRDFATMPVEINRLFRSKAWLLAKRKPELGFYMMNLWLVSWHELPAASLPDDDDALADFARCAPARWRKVRADVMRGWVKCTDGRLYHSTVAEKARKAWATKLSYRDRTAAAREARQRQRQSPAKSSVAESVTDNVTETVTDNVTASKGREEKEREGKERESLSERGAGAPGDLASVVFGQGLAWLVNATGKPERECRSLLGKWRGAHGDAALIEALGAAQRHGPIDPIPWLTKALQERGPGGSKSKGAENFETRAIAAEAFARARDGARGDRPRRRTAAENAAAFAVAFAPKHSDADGLEPIGEASIAEADAGREDES